MSLQRFRYSCLACHSLIVWVPWYTPVSHAMSALEKLCKITLFTDTDVFTSGFCLLIYFEIYSWFNALVSYWSPYIIFPPYFRMVSRILKLLILEEYFFSRNRVNKQVFILALFSFHTHYVFANKSNLQFGQTLLKKQETRNK